MEIVRASTSLSASILVRPGAPSVGVPPIPASITPHPSSSILDAPPSTSLLLASLTSYDRAAFEDAMQRTIKLLKKFQKLYADVRDRGRDKVSIGNFQIGDVALFLPTRNFTAVVRPWAAFNGELKSEWGEEETELTSKTQSTSLTSSSTRRRNSHSTFWR